MALAVLAALSMGVAVARGEDSQRQERIPAAFVFWSVPDAAAQPGGDALQQLPFWHDPGFRGAMRLLQTEHHFDLVHYNLAEEDVPARLEAAVASNAFAFILSKGCWHTPADKMMRSTIIRRKAPGVKTGIFPACSSPPPADEETGKSIALAYDVVFYDKVWLAPTFAHHPLAVHAFGIDTPRTFNASSGVAWGEAAKLFDYVSVGMLAPWKRHENLVGMPGDAKLVVGYGWRSEASSEIVSTLFTAGIAVWQRVAPARMCDVYRASRRVYMGATELGGGERVILEARACGVPSDAIEIEADNAQLAEFIHGPIYASSYYAAQFAKGIRAALSGEGGRGGEAPSQAEPTVPEPFKISVR